MRLRDFRQLIEKNVQAFKCTVNQHPNKGNLKTITEYLPAIAASEDYRLKGIFPTLTKRLSSYSEIYNDKTGNVTVDATVATAFNNAVENLYSVSISFLELLDNTIPKQDPNAIVIKLPNLSNLDDLSDFFDKLNMILNQSLVNEYVKGQVKIQNFDSGSFWIEILVGSQIAISLLTGIVWAAAVIAKKIMEGRLLEEQVRGYEIRNEILEELKEAAKNQIDLVLDAETNNLIDKLNLQKPDPEYTSRLRHSINTMAELIIKGTEVHPALTAPENVKNLLPDFGNLSNIQSQIKQLQQ